MPRTATPLHPVLDDEAVLRTGRAAKTIADLTLRTIFNYDCDRGLPGEPKPNPTALCTRSGLIGVVLSGRPKLCFRGLITPYGYLGLIADNAQLERDVLAAIEHTLQRARIHLGRPMHGHRDYRPITSIGGVE